MDFSAWTALATKGEAIYKAINALYALAKGYINREIFFRVEQATDQLLAAAGFENLNINHNHLLLSIDKSDQLLTDGEGLPIARLCDFEMLRCL